MSFVSQIRKPSAFLPTAMSLAALARVALQLAFGGVTRQATARRGRPAPLGRAWRWPAQV